MVSNNFKLWALLIIHENLCLANESLEIGYLLGQLMLVLKFCRLNRLQVHLTLAEINAADCSSIYGFYLHALSNKVI